MVKTLLWNNATFAKTTGFVLAKVALFQNHDFTMNQDPFMQIYDLNHGEIIFLTTLDVNRTSQIRVTKFHYNYKFIIMAKKDYNRKLGSALSLRASAMSFVITVTTLFA
jgi:hypothetical protein